MKLPLSTKSSTIWKLVIPILLGNLAQTAISLTDTAFLGRLGEIELGAAAMSGIYYFCFTTLAWGFAIGLQIIVARRVGEKRFHLIGNTLLHGMMFILPFATLLFSLLKFVSPLFMKSALSSEAVYYVSMEFLDYRSFGIFFASVNFMFRSFYIGLSKTKSIGYSTLLMAITNIVLDWALIFGSPLNEPMGVKGAAIASVSAEISATILFILYTTFAKPIEGYPIFKGYKFDFSIIKSIFSLSSNTMLQKMISYGAWITFFLLIEKMGERSLAVTMVARSAFMLIVMPAFAFGAAANSVSSQLIGAGRQNEVLPTTFKIIKMCTVVITALVILLFINPTIWVGVYTDSDAIIKQTIPIMYLLCVAAYGYSFAMPLFETVSGTGYTKFALYVEVVTLIGYLTITWLFAIALQKSLLMVWTAEICYSFILAIGSYLFLRYYKWQNKKV